MKLFYTNSSAKEEIGNLETRISSLEADGAADATEIAKLTEELKTANESLAAITTERDEAVAAFQAAETTATQATADLTTANENLATFDEKVEAAAQAKFEGLGGPPIPASGKDENPESAMTRSDFKALGPRARLDFVLAGGKIS